MPPRETVTTSRDRIHVSLLAVPDVSISSLTGLYDVFNTFTLLGTLEAAVPQASPFDVEIVSPEHGRTTTSCGLPIETQRHLREVRQTDIVIAPSMLVAGAEWKCRRYPELVAWLRRQHARGAMLCSACSGVLLLAETGLLDGLDATIHWAYARTFQKNFPKVRLRLEEVLIATGSRQEIVMSGASASWHDLVLYLIARQVGPAAAQAIARFLLLQWHRDGQAPYVPFAPPTDHGDDVVRQLQDWLLENHSVASPVEELVRRSGLPERTIKRRFTRATGLSPIRSKTCEWKRRNAASKGPISPLTRSAMQSVMKIRLPSAGCSVESRASHQGTIAANSACRHLPRW
jgi:transcriptional regulator GlxA family with amidase domain